MDKIKEELLKFLKSQKLIIIASQGDTDIGISNIYYGIDEDFKIYFISPKDTEHSKHILKNSKITFSIAWYNPENHKDRKAIQAKGNCIIATLENDKFKGVKLHNLNFPEFKERITEEWILDDSIDAEVWVIEPTSMKFWNDELFGLNGNELIEFDK